ncbi:MAG: hypothetical protein J7L76_06380 [Spirochaetaceae bacterium]|nr:hypothetical protein [Spirochaetaceae bacterium]
MSRRVVLPLLIAMAAAGISSAVEWYQSSPGGISGSPLTGGGPEAVGWSLSVDNGTDYSDGREIRLLYLDGELFSSTVYYRSNGRMTARENLDSRRGSIPCGICLRPGGDSPGYVHHNQ